MVIAEGVILVDKINMNHLNCLYIFLKLKNFYDFEFCVIQFIYIHDFTNCKYKMSPTYESYSNYIYVYVYHESRDNLAVESSSS